MAALLGDSLDVVTEPPAGMSRGKVTTEPVPVEEPCEISGGVADDEFVTAGELTGGESGEPPPVFPAAPTAAEPPSGVDADCHVA